MNEKIIGIDLGTTNSEVAVVENARVVVIETSPGQKILPSFVGLADDGSVLVGEPAKNQYILYPERTIKSIKRRMGSAEKVPMGADAYIWGNRYAKR
jgi:molecular chaperone DnaK (HSP70)